MFLLEYEYKDLLPPGWNFEKLTLKKINLIVGQSAVGKSRILNTLTNFCRFVNDSKPLAKGEWNIKFKSADKIYRYHVKLSRTEIISEELLLTENSKETEIITRDKNKFIFSNSNLPKLDYTKLSINLLKNEDAIHPVYEDFNKIYRRNFFDKDLNDQSKNIQFNEEIENDLKNNPNAINYIPLSVRLFYLSKNDKDKYELICDYYKRVFPFINEIKFLDLRELAKNFPIPINDAVPIMSFTEKENKNITFNELSTGMQKVLLILTDIVAIPQNSVYIIDEYENSLGENAIDFLPELLLERNINAQFLITSHHPYLINAIPVENWQVLNRKGQNVSVINGESLKEKYGKSKQKSFTQLINDKIYEEGVQ